MTTTVADNPYFGYDTKIEFTEDGTLYESIGCIRDAVEVDPGEVEAIDVTCFGGSGAVRNYRPGILDPGEVTFQVLRSPGDASDIRLSELLGKFGQWRITYPNGGTDEFGGFMTKRPSTTPMAGDAMVTDITVRISGEIVTTAPPNPRKEVA